VLQSQCTYLLCICASNDLGKRISGQYEAIDDTNLCWNTRSYGAFWYMGLKLSSRNSEGRKRWEEGQIP